MTARAGGRVVSLRISPADCIAIASVCQKLGLGSQQITFAQGARIALSALIESARTGHLIPASDGFDFLEQMSWFKPTEQSLRLSVGSITELPQPHTANIEKQRRRLRFQELRLQKEQDHENWTPALQEEFRPLVEEFFEAT